MTLIVIGMNKIHLVQVSDRRITTDSLVLDDEFCKSFYIDMPGFRLAVAFTGVARVGPFNTRAFIQSHISNMGTVTQDPITILDSLSDALTHKFNDNMTIKFLPANKKRLDVVITGYNYSFDPPLGLNAEISNISTDGNKFVVSYSGESRPNDGKWVWMGIYGNYVSISESHISQLRLALTNNLPIRALQSIIENRIRSESDDIRTGKTIGRQLDVIAIKSDRFAKVVTSRSTSVPKREITWPGAVVIGPGGASMAIANMTVSAVGPNPRPMSVPTVHRNAPCPCGSGRKFRLCHKLSS